MRLFRSIYLRHERVWRACLASVCVAGALLVAPAGFAQTSPELVRVRVAANPDSPDLAAILYAEQAGLFRRAGLDVSIEHASAGATIAAGVAGGSFEVGKATIAVIIAAHDKGLPFTIVAPAAVYNGDAPVAGFVVAKNWNIQSGSDFAGKTVGVVTLHDIGRVALDLWIAHHGGDPSKVTYIEVPLAAAVPALQQHRIAAAELSYPLLAEALSPANGFRLFPALDAVAHSFLMSVWFSTTDWANKHPAAVEAFARTVEQAAVYTNAHPEEAAKLMSDFTAVPYNQMLTAIKVMKCGTDVSVQAVQPAIDAAAGGHVIKHAFSAKDIIFAP